MEMRWIKLTHITPNGDKEILVDVSKLYCICQEEGRTALCSDINEVHPIYVRETVADVYKNFF